jgi:lipoic acid synthetase
MSDQAAVHEPKPEWLTVRLPAGAEYVRLKQIMRSQGLHTVCEEARCPNVAECWNAGTATFMILGDVCTRACGFCAVTSGRPGAVDAGEPARVAQAVAQMGLRHAVVTSVDRDDLADGGASLFADTIRWIRRLSPGTTIEVLIPDFAGNWNALAEVMAARPEILDHNIETVPRLYPRVRPRAHYARSLDLLQRAKALAPASSTKSGIMVGLGEARAEISAVLRDLRAAGCDILTVGQYLRPSARHVPLVRYYRPEEFSSIAAEGRSLGFRYVEAGPLVRSSYHAERHVATSGGRPSERLGSIIPLRDLPGGRDAFP